MRTAEAILNKYPSHISRQIAKAAMEEYAKQFASQPKPVPTREEIVKVLVEAWRNTEMQHIRSETFEVFATAILKLLNK